MTFLTRKALPRRTFLRGMGATLALPMLDAMAPALSAKAAAPTPRLGFVYISNGVIQEQWNPAAVGAGRLFVEIEPQVQRRKPRKPDEAGVVGVARRDDSTRPAHSPHFPQRLHGIGDVLQHLMGVDNIEAVVGKDQSMHV